MEQRVGHFLFRVLTGWPEFVRRDADAVCFGCQMHRVVLLQIPQPYLALSYLCSEFYRSTKVLFTGPDWEDDSRQVPGRGLTGSQRVQGTWLLETCCKRTIVTQMASKTRPSELSEKTLRSL